MTVSSLSIVPGSEVDRVLQDRESDVMAAVRDAYVAFGAGEVALPQSTFLRFPKRPGDRIIALPAYPGDRLGVAGLKWISSFPGNIERGTDRASAVQVLNDMESGRPFAILEASTISAKRTAASAALAAQLCRDGQPPQRFVLVGCGYINFEVLGFLAHVFQETKDVLLVDLDDGRSNDLRKRAREQHPQLQFECRSSFDDMFFENEVICFATNAASPHVLRGDAFGPRTVVLNVSLRDLAPEVILASCNLVDSRTHVCRENTSIHLAALEAGHTDFIAAEIHELIHDRQSLGQGDEDVVVFSPFGLGILDVVVAKFVLDACSDGEGIQRIDNFFPPSWLKK